MMDEQWQIHLAKGLKPHFSEMRGLMDEAIGKWAAGDYYGSGVAVGTMDKYAFSYWVEP